MKVLELFAGTRSIGNAVPPAFATALARANWPEACGEEITTMAALNDAWAV